MYMANVITILSASWGNNIDNVSQNSDRKLVKKDQLFKFKIVKLIIRIFNILHSAKI